MESFCEILDQQPPILTSHILTTVCRFYKHQKCTKGQLCPYSHNLKNDACSFLYLKNGCNKGDDCPYEHRNITLLQRINLLKDQKIHKMNNSERKKVESDTCD